MHASFYVAVVRKSCNTDRPYGLLEAIIGFSRTDVDKSVNNTG